MLKIGVDLGQFVLQREVHQIKATNQMRIYNVGLPFERVHMDILGPFSISSLGNKYVLDVTDCFTKWVEAFPLSNMRTKTIAEVFVREIVCSS